MSLLLMSLTTFLTKQQMLITKAIFLLPSDCVKPALLKALTWEHKSWEWFAWPHKGNVVFFFFFDLEFSGNVGNKKAVVKIPTVLTWFLLWEKCSEDMHDAVAPGEDRLGGRTAVRLSTGELQRSVERLNCAPSGGCVLSSSLFNSWVLGKKYPASSQTLTFLFSLRWVSVAVGGKTSGSYPMFSSFHCLIHECLEVLSWKSHCILAVCLFIVFTKYLWKCCWVRGSVSWSLIACPLESGLPSCRGLYCLWTCDLGIINTWLLCGLVLSASKWG